MKIFFAIFLAFLTALPADAELAIVTKPVAVTNGGVAHLSLEASSSHVALHVVAPVEVSSGVWQTQISVLAFQPNAVEPLSTFDMAVKTSITELALRSFGSPAELGVAIIDRNFSENVSPFPGLPAPNIRWTIRAQGDDARAVLARWNAMTDPRQLSYNEVQSVAIAEMSYALDAVRLNQVSRTQKAPLAARAPQQTAMHWLYQRMLVYARPGLLSEANNQSLAGCQISPENGPGAATETPFGLYLKATDWLESTPPETFFARIMDATRVQLLRKSRLYQAHSIAELVNWGRRIGPAFGLYGDFLLNGDIDPVVVDIARCAATRILQGDTMVLRTIRDRSVAYEQVDRLLAERWQVAPTTGEPPRFFAAASAVTRLMGVGASETLSAYDIDEQNQLIEAVLGVDTRGDGCGTMASGSMLPDVAGREVLRDINARLFDFVNIPVMRELYASPGNYDVEGSRTDLAGWKSDDNWQPNPGLLFDLQMVLREQVAIEELLTERDLRADTVASLSNSQTVLRCSYSVGVLGAIFGEASTPGLVQSVNASLVALRQENLIADDQIGFENYWWRVGTGMAYMLALHGEEPEKLLPILRFLLAKERQTTALPADLSMLVAGVREAEAADGQISAELDQALQWYLGDDLAERGLSACTATGVQLGTRILTDVAALDRRAVGLVGWNGGQPANLAPLAWVYELTPGGALAETATAPPMLSADRPILCNALQRRFDRLDAAVTPPAILLDLPETTSVSLFAGSAGLRAELARLEPFASVATSPERPTTLPDVRAQLLRAVRNEAIYSAHLALVARATVLPAGQWTILFPGVNRQDAVAAVRAAMPVGVSQSAADAAGLSRDDLVAAMSAQARQDRITETRDALATIAGQLIAAAGTDVAAGEPIAPLDVWASVGPMRYAGVDLAMNASLGQQPNGVPLLAGLLQIEVSDTGDTFPVGHPLEGLPQNEIAFSVRRALTTDPEASAAATAERLADSADGKAALPFASPDFLPLGFSLSPVFVTPEGHIRFDGLEGLRNVMEQQPHVTRQTLRELGLPTFMAVDGMEAEINISDEGAIDRLVLRVELIVAGTRLGVLDIALVEDGEGVPIEDALERAVKAFLEEKLSTTLSAANRFLETMRLPASQGAYEAAQIRFGVIPNESGEALSYDLDWAGETLTVSTTYALEIRDTDTLQAEISIPATAQLIASPSAFEVRTFQFDEGAEAEIAKLPIWLLSQLGLADQIEGPLGSSLSVTPVLEENDLRLHVAFDVPVEGCDIRIDEVLPFDIDAISDVIGDQLEEVAQNAAICALDRTIAGSLDQIFDLEVDLFGIKARIAEDGQGAAALVNKLRQDGRLDLEVVVDAPWAQTCGLSTAQRTLTGLSVNLEGDLSLDGMDQAERRKLGAVILCRVESVVDLGDTLLLTDPEVGRGSDGETVVLIDVTVQNLPYLGTVAVGPVDFTSLDEETLDSVLDAVLEQVAARAAEDLSVRLKGESLEMEGIGEVRLAADKPFDFDITDDGFDIIARGELIVQDFMLPINLKVSVPSGKLDVDIPDDAIEAAALGGLQALIADYMPDLPFGGITIDPVQFGPLDDRNLRYGLVIGVKADLDFFEYPLAFAMDRIAISDRGVDLPQKITLGVGAPIPLPTPPVPIWLSKITMTLFTENADEPGLVAGADLTVIEASLARIIKFAVELDLRHIDELRMSAEGNLILVNSVNLFRVFSEIDLNRGAFEFDGKTNSDFADILDAQVYGLMVIEDAFITTQSKLAVLGLDLTRDELSICASASDCAPDVPPGIRIRSNADLLITQNAITVDVDNEFKDPQAGGQITLRLFDWTVGSAGLQVNLDEAALGLSFLGIDLNITTPTIELLSPGYIASILASLFDISLEDLLNIDPANLRISVIGSGGDVSTVKDGDSDDTGGNSNDRNQSQGEPSDTSLDTQEPSPVDPPEQAEGEKNIKEWGVSVDNYICIHVVGIDPARGFRDGIDGGRVELRGHDGALPPRNWWGFNHNGDVRNVALPPTWPALSLTWVVPDAPSNAVRFNWMRAFPESSVSNQGVRPSGEERTIRPLCTLNDNRVATVQDGQSQIGSARRVIDPIDVCWSGSAAFSRPSYRLVKLDEDANANFALAGLPVYCLGGSQHNFIDTAFFLEGDGQTIRVMFDCPHLMAVDPWVRNNSIWQRACGPTARPLMIEVSELEDQIADPKGGVGFTAMSEIVLINRFVIPYLEETYEETEEQRISFELAGAQAQVTATIGSNGADISVVVQTLNTESDEVEIRPVTIPETLPFSDQPNPLHPVFLSPVGDYAFAKEIIRIWLENGSLPRVAYEALGTETLLILEAGDGSGQVIEILRLNDTEITATKLTLPQFYPDGSINGPFQRDDWEALLTDVFLEDLIGVEDGSSWRAIVGINESRDIHYYALIGEPDGAGERAIRLRRDEFRSAATNLQTIPDLRQNFSGDHDPTPPDARRFCYNDTLLINELNDLLPAKNFESELRSLFDEYFMRPDVGLFELQRLGALDDLDLRLEWPTLCSDI